MTIDPQLVRITSWERIPKSPSKTASTRITFAYRNHSELPTLGVTFDVPGHCSDEEALQVARNWFHMLCTNLGNGTKEWALAQETVQKIQARA